MKISRENVEHIGKLARLDLGEEEKEAFSHQLSSILTYMDQLKLVKTDGIIPTATVIDQTNVFREDEVRPSLSQGEALSNAPEAADGFLRVPKIISDR